MNIIALQKLLRNLASACIGIGLLFLTACGGSASTSAIPDQAALVADDVVPGIEIKMDTSLGEVVIELNSEKAPLTVENFLNYVDSGYYDGTIFHRVIETFMIQGGGFDANYQQKPTLDPVANEADNGLKNSTYTIAMARTADPQSATAQFFINVQNNTFLDYSAPTIDGWGYAVFGRVTSGTEVVDLIKASATDAGGPFPKDVPVETVTINSINRVLVE